MAPQAPNMPAPVKKILGWLTDLLNIGRGWGWWNKRPSEQNKPRDIRPPKR